MSAAPATACGALVALLPALPVAAAAHTYATQLPNARFGTVTVYIPDGPPRSVAIFLSGDGGWQLGVTSMARTLTDMGAVVIGADIRHYLAGLKRAAQRPDPPCQMLAADRLLQFLGEITDLPEEEARDAGMAFREMLLNAMEHGGKFDPEKYVEICYVRARHVVMARIKDPGDGFTLDEVRHAAIGNPPDDPIAHVIKRNEAGMRPGGYGVMLAKNLVDELIYGEKGNEVLLVKYLPGFESAPPRQA